MKHRRRSVSVNGLKRTVLVTGANRGIGFETARQLIIAGCDVILGARSRNDARYAANALALRRCRIGYVKLDVSSVDDISTAVRYARRRFGHLDVLINNAGVFPEKRASGNFTRFSSVRFSDIQHTIHTNLIGTLLVTRAFIPLLRRGSRARIINISSGMGRIVEMDGCALAYRVSKAGINVATRAIASDLKEFGIEAYAVCPGWVKSDMGGGSAVRTARTAAREILQAALYGLRPKSGALIRGGEDFGF